MALAAVLAVVLLGGVGWLLFGPFPEREFYYIGIQRGASDAAIGKDVGSAVQHPFGAALYLVFWSQDRPKEKQVLRMAKHMSSASRAGKRRYLAAFAKGYQVGHKLQRVRP